MLPEWPAILGRRRRILPGIPINSVQPFISQTHTELTKKENGGRIVGRVWGAGFGPPGGESLAVRTRLFHSINPELVN